MINHHKFCIAPMMKKTDKHFRFMARQFTKNSMLYTEMIHSNAILKGDADKLLKYHNSEHPVGLQLGGSDPRSLAEAAIIGEDYGYDEINLNVGCPSKKVKSGNFGVFLMKNVELLSSCINEVKKNINTPFTIKCRIGVDDFEGEKYLENFLSTISDYGITTFIIHARKAISGLDTKRNRSIPPLNYGLVYKMKERFPEFKIIINGGIEEIGDVVQSIIVNNNHLFVIANNSHKIKRYSITESGLNLPGIDIETNNSSPREMVIVNDKLYFMLSGNFFNSFSEIKKFFLTQIF